MTGASEQKNRTTLEAFLREAERLVRTGQYRVANRILAKLAVDDPYRPEIWSCLSRLRTRQGKGDEARLFGDVARAMA